MGKALCNSQTNGGMTIMPAGVHPPFTLRGKSRNGWTMLSDIRFMNGQGIHIKAECQNRPLSTLKLTTDCCLSCRHLIQPFPTDSGLEGRRFRCLHILN